MQTYNLPLVAGSAVHLRQLGLPIQRKKHLHVKITWKKLHFLRLAVLSSEMSELKRLLQKLQPVVPISPATVSQEDEERSSRRKEEEPLSSSSPSRHTEYDVLSTSASDSFFQEHLTVCVQSFPQDTQTVLSKAEGSSEDSVH